MDVTRLTRGERIAGIAGLALFIIMFFSWFGSKAVSVSTPGGTFSVAGGAVTVNAWQSFSWIDLILFITVISAVALAVIRLTETRLDLPVAVSAVTAGLGALSTLLVLYRILNPIDDASRKFGIFLGLIAAGAVTYGGWLAMQEEGTTFGDQADRLRDRPGGGPGAGPSPPPPPPPSGGPPPSSGPPPASGP